MLERMCVHLGDWMSQVGNKDEKKDNKFTGLFLEVCI